MAEGQFIDLRRPVHDLAAQIPRLLGQRRSIRVEVDVDEAAKLFDLYLIEADFRLIEPLERLGVWRHLQLTIEPVGPGVIRAPHMTDRAFTLQ